MSRIHDNIVSSYGVDFENEQLILKTQYYCGSKLTEHANIIFDGYFTHIFDNEQKGSIIFDIEECTPTYFYEREHECIERSKNYSWPINYQTPDTKTELIKFVRDNEFKVFEISSSYGLCGWVLAKNMDIIFSEV